MGYLLGQSLINGLMIGGVYALIAVGLTIIFGVMKIINFAQGEFLMLGMYLTWIIYSVTGLSPYVLIPLVFALMFLFGMGAFQTVFRPLIGRDSTRFILLTMGLSYFLENAAQLVFSNTYRTVITSVKDSAIRASALSISTPRLIAFLVALVLVTLVFLFLKHSKVGRAMRATAENREVAQMLGINTNRTFLFSFALGVAMAGLAGLLLTPIYYVYPRVGGSFKTIAMVVVVLGGLGNTAGALIGGLIAGIVEAFVGTYVALDLAPAGVFALLLLVLYFRPQGLFGKGARKA